jgi:hypothetical protein
MMTRLSVAAAIILTLAIGAGTVRAEDAAAPGVKMSRADKKAISKSCSDQADAKGLQGKKRKKFRRACKHHGGKAE